MPITITTTGIRFFPRPSKQSYFKLTIGGTDVTARIKEADFRKLATIGVGDFKIKLSNVGGVYDDLGWVGGTEIIFYADYKDATQKQFTGRIDFVQSEVSNNEQVKVLEGRHISYPVLETHVTYSTTAATDGATLLKYLVDNFLTGFTYTNTTDPIGTTMSVTWNEKPLWKCVQDICTKCGADCYIDNDLDFHLFVKNSVTCTKDAISERNNIRWVRGFGKDTSEERDNIRVYGEDNEGVPIIYTSGTGIRETIIKDTSIESEQEAQDIADATYSEQLTATDEGKAKSLGLPDLNPGERMYIYAPRANVTVLERIAEIKHTVKRGEGWRTEVTVEKKEAGTSELMKERIDKELQLRKIDNPNQLSYSYNFTFDDDTGLVHTDTETSEGRLQIVSGTAGSCITDSKTTASNVTQVELRIVGSDLTSSIFRVSTDGGIHWTVLTKDTLTTIPVAERGDALRIRIILNSDSDNPNPLLESLAILYDLT